MNAKRVLVLMHPDLMPPSSLKGHTPRQINVWKTEYDVISTLRRLGHVVRPLGVQDDVLPIRTAVHTWHPHIVFNLLEEFHGDALFDHHIVSYLELLRVRYTGNSPRGLVISRDKALAKKILAYHGIRVPGFAVAPRGRRARLPEALSFPLIVKSLVEHASYGISSASVVRSERALATRVEYVHDHLGTDAIMEEYVEGRELYVGVIGNRRPHVLPIWELLFENLPPNMPSDRDGEGQARHRRAVPVGHLPAPRRGPAAGVDTPDPAELPADLPGAGTRRVRQDRLPATG